MRTSGAERHIPEGFPHQRLTVIPANVIQRCRRCPAVRFLYVSHIGTFPTAPNHYVERKNGAPETLLIYCLSGKGTLHLGKAVFPIEPGHVLLIPPHTPHRYEADEQDPWSIFWIHFSGTGAADCLAGLGVTADHPLLYVPDRALMQTLFENTYACLNYHYTEAGLLAMSGELLRLIGQIKLHGRSRREQQQAAYDRILSTVDFMQRHLDMPLSLAEMADRAGQSVSYYCRLFKQRTGQAPMNYFLQLKVRKACELLDHTRLNVKEIALELGYDDPYYFSRLFKKIQGCSPAVYRTLTKG
jgi:AraC-like DNA-binding protein